MADELTPPVPGTVPAPVQPAKPGWMEQYGPLVGAAISGYLNAIASPRYGGMGQALNRGAQGALGTGIGLHDMALQAQAQRQREAAIAGLPQDQQRAVRMGATGRDVLNYESDTAAAAAKTAGIRQSNTAKLASLQAVKSDPAVYGKLNDFQRKALDTHIENLANAPDEPSDHLSTIMNNIGIGTSPLTEQLKQSQLTAANQVATGTKPPSPRAPELVDATEMGVRAKAEKLAKDQWTDKPNILSRGYHAVVGGSTGSDVMKQKYMKYAGDKAVFDNRLARGIPPEVAAQGLDLTDPTADTGEPQAQPSPTDRGAPGPTPTPASAYHSLVGDYGG